MTVEELIRALVAIDDWSQPVIVRADGRDDRRLMCEVASVGEYADAMSECLVIYADELKYAFGGKP